MFLVKKSENIEFWNFLVFLKSRDFAGFSMENWLISAYNSPISIPRQDLERILNFLKMFKRSNQDLRTIKWSTEAPKSTEGEKSPTWVKCSIRRNSNIEILMSIYVFMESQWFV